MPISREKLWDYFILTARVLAGLTLISYGFAKLTGGQFGLQPVELTKPVNELSLFHLSWYLFDKEPFKSFIGVCQVISGALILFNRTVLIGVLMSIPIWANILIIDITFLKITAFYWRLSFYLFLSFLVLWQYKKRVVEAVKTLSVDLKPAFSYPFWAYALLPVAALFLELAGGTITMGYHLITDTHATLERLGRVPELLIEIWRKMWN